MEGMVTYSHQMKAIDRPVYTYIPVVSVVYLILPIEGDPCYLPAKNIRMLPGFFREGKREKSSPLVARLGPEAMHQNPIYQIYLGWLEPFHGGWKVKHFKINTVFLLGRSVAGKSTEIFYLDDLQSSASP